MNKINKELLHPQGRTRPHSRYGDLEDRLSPRIETDSGARINKGAASLIFVLAGIIVIGAALISGKIIKDSEKQAPPPPSITPSPTPTPPSDIVQLNQQSDSDSVESIELDLNNTDFSNLDSELPDIESQVNNL